MRCKYKCKYCGQLYSLSPDWSGKTFCSALCKHKHSHPVYKCDECGVLFRTTHSTKRTHKHIYCSPECYAIARTKKNTRSLIRCDFCGKCFKIYKTLRPHEHKFCSSECFQKYKTLPRSKDTRLIEYCYQLAGAGLIERITKYKTKHTQVQEELRGVALDTISKFLSSQQFKSQLIGYISKSMDGYIKKEYTNSKKQNKIFWKYLHNLEEVT